jgi:hypothetical protein
MGTSDKLSLTSCFGPWPPQTAQNRRLAACPALFPKWRAATDDDEHYVYAMAL